MENNHLKRENNQILFSRTFPYWSISNRSNSNQQENVTNTRFENKYKEIGNQKQFLKT